MINVVNGKLLSTAVSVRVNSVRTMYPSYHRHLVTLPRTRIGFPEKVFWGFFMAFGILATPAWVLTHLDDYKGKNKKSD